GATAWLRLRLAAGAAFEDGAVSLDGRTCGSYVHGLFDDARFSRRLIETLRRRRGLKPLGDRDWVSQREFWTARYQRLAAWLKEHCDLRSVEAALMM
ncbi:MAG TPA: cobyric acid synthase, partial [Isosphaeraceae bacterium]|nr:cobyric acid synthase [Isosphaeraceae bacterium]